MTALTPAQREALYILRRMDGTPIGSWKRSSVYQQSFNGGPPITRLNNNVASNLCRLRLARRIMGRSFNAYGATDKFEITEAGREWSG